MISVDDVHEQFMIAQQQEEEEKPLPQLLEPTRRNVISLEKKKRIIDAADDGTTTKELGLEFKLPKTTISKILSSKQAILDAIDKSGAEMCELKRTNEIKRIIALHIKMSVLKTNK